MMPDELPYAYEGRPYDEILSLLKQRDDEIDGWRALWKDEHRRRIEAEGGHRSNDATSG